MGKLRTPLFVLICGVLLQAGCGAYHTGDPLDNVRRVFVGTWEGEHVDDEGNLLRTWIQRRFEDGTYATSFVHCTEKGIRRSGQRGKWWIDGNRFYEIAPSVMEEPDVYEFEILNNNEIRFKSTVTDYEFIDRRVLGPHDVTFI